MTIFWELGSEYATTQTCFRNQALIKVLCMRTYQTNECLPNCLVLQDKKASDSFEHAMTVMQINSFLKPAMRQLKGIRLEATNEEVVLTLLSRFSWFKVYPGLSVIRGNCDSNLALVSFQPECHKHNWGLHAAACGTCTVPYHRYITCKPHIVTV